MDTIIRWTSTLLVTRIFFGAFVQVGRVRHLLHLESLVHSTFSLVTMTLFIDVLVLLGIFNPCFIYSNTATSNVAVTGHGNQSKRKRKRKRHRLKALRWVQSP